AVGAAPSGLKLSIIIATHKRPESLNLLLAILTPQLHTGDHEVFIADNGTPAPTPITAAFPITHIYDPRPGKCRVQNRAIAEARGAIIACLDDDLAPAPDYATGVIRFFADHPEFAAMRGRIL